MTQSLSILAKLLRAHLPSVSCIIGMDAHFRPPSFWALVPNLHLTLTLTLTL